MSEDFLEDIGAATLMGTIGGLLGRHQSALDVRPIIAEGSHKMKGLRVTTEHGVFEVKVEPAR